MPVPITIVALVLLAVLFKQAASRDFLRVGSVSLVVSGAVGNLWDRVRWDLGVVDFGGGGVLADKRDDAELRFLVQGDDVGVGCGIFFEVTFS